MLTSMVEYLPEPFEILDRPLWWHLEGLQETASGYGSRLRSPYCIRLPDGRVRRVYVTIWGNAGTCWVILNGRRFVVRECDGTRVDS